TIDGAASGIQGTIDRVHRALKGTDGTLGGTAAVDRDFVHAVYGNFPYVLAFVIVLTLILLARAFRSIVLAFKAALLNLVSLAAAIIFDATVIRALLVPALMRLLGRANWWMPHWTRSVLFIRHRESPPEVATENA